MDTYMVVLRIVHILAGVFWVGAALTMFLFLQPTAEDVGPAAGPFMTHLATRRRLPDVMLAAAGLTILAGLLMFWRVSNGLDADWIGTATGVTLTIGALSAIVAFSIGLSVSRPAMLSVAGIGRAVAASGGPPTPDQAAQLQALQGRARRAGSIVTVLLIVAVITMAAARYL